LQASIPDWRTTTRLDAVRAHLLEMAGDTDSAVAHYLRAAGKTRSIAERNYLMAKAARLATAHTG
jgi:predicted RNA polymerase sigma factor